jgi:hypothetical protein
MGFLISGDGRGFAVSNFHRTDVSRNISISATADCDCLTCGRTHSYKDSVAKGKPLVAALSDQAFPPMLPSSRGDCVLVIRVEGGLLTEIESTFFDYAFGGGLTDGGLPVGSVIMVGSVTHLGTRGLGSYAEDLVKTISSVGARVGHGVEVVPVVHVPLGGLRGAGVVRDAYNLDSWIIAMGSPGAALQDAREVLCKSQVKETEKDGGMGVERNIYLPCSTKNPRKRNFFSPGTVRPLPGGFAPLGSDTESLIVFALMSELNKNYGLQLDPFPSLECGVVTQADKATTNRYIVVGGSHMHRMAAYMPDNTTSLAEPGSRAEPSTCGKISQRLTELKPDNEGPVILDLLSNSSFMGTNEDGMPLQMMPMGDGKYHVPGSLIPTTMSIIRKTLQSCDCIAAADKNSQVILFGPSPCYVIRRCCDDADHLENYNSPDYESEILGGIDSINRTIEKWASEHRLNFTMIDPTEQSEPADFPLRERVTPDGSSWWTSSDPVHLSRGGISGFGLHGHQDADH